MGQVGFLFRMVTYPARLIAGLVLCGAVLSGCSGGEPSANSGSGGTHGGGAGGAGGSGGLVAGAGGIEGELRLSEAGLYRNFAARELAQNVSPYEVQFPLWSDGSEKRRYLQLPEGAQIDTSIMDRWVFPVGTAAWKEFWVDGAIIETRLIRKLEVGWESVAFVWSEDGSDALAAPLGLENALGTSHDVPSETQCASCHQADRDWFLGVGALQLSEPGATQSSLRRFNERGWLSAPPAREYSPPGSAEQAQVLGYLHGNCSGCHSNEHPLASRNALRLQVFVDQELADTGFMLTAVGRRAIHQLAGAEWIVSPGSAEGSQLYQRMALRDLLAMPPLGTEQVDQAALIAVRNMIEQLPAD